MRTVFGAVILILFITYYQAVDQQKYFVTQATVLLMLSFCGLYTSAYFINKKIRKFLKVQNTINFISILPLIITIFMIAGDQEVLMVTAVIISLTKSINDFYKTDQEFKYFVIFTTFSIIISGSTKLILILKSSDITRLIDLLLLEEFVRQILISIHYGKQSQNNLSYLSFDIKFKIAIKIVIKNFPIFLSTYLAANKIRMLIIISNWLYPNNVLQVSYSVKVYDLLLGLHAQISTYIWANIRRLKKSLAQAKLRIYNRFYFRLTIVMCSLSVLIAYVVLKDYFYLFCVVLALPIMALSPCLVQILIRENQYKSILLVELCATGMLVLMILIYGLLFPNGDYLVSFASCLSLFFTYTMVIQRTKYSLYAYYK